MPEGLPILGDTSFTFSGCNSSQGSGISLGWPVATFLIRSLCPGAAVMALAGLRGPHAEINGDTMLRSAFSLFKTQASSSETF